MNLIHTLSLRYHRSRLPWRDARRYTAHWRRCQREQPRGIYTNGHAQDLRTVGVTRLTTRETDPFTGALDAALLGYFLCPYTIFYAKTYRSRWSPAREGSQRWHADGGPGSCVIVMVYHSRVTDWDGPFEWVSWRESLKLYQREPQGTRDALCDFYDREVKRYSGVIGPAGTAILFSNNVLHRGGFPHPGHERLVTVYHCYPSLRGDHTLTEKTAAYPVDPDI